MNGCQVSTFIFLRADLLTHASSVNFSYGRLVVCSLTAKQSFNATQWHSTGARCRWSCSVSVAIRKCLQSNEIYT